LEFVLGAKSESAIARFGENTRAREALQKRFHEPTLWDSFLRYLKRVYSVPDEVLQRDVTRPVEPSPALQEVLLHIYRTNPRDAELCERLVDLDEGMQEWRYRHVKMVERTIGMKMGTGGSAGAAYLRTTLSKPAFPDLWEIRSQL
jgi:tryptophan 2,3-dioxygenase